MAKRYYLSPLAQDSVGRWKPSLLLSAEWAAEAEGKEANIVTSGFTAGQPDVSWCLLVVNAINHASLGAVSGVFLMPDITLDARLSTLSTTVRNNLLNRLTQLGVDVSGITTTTIFRTVLGRVAANRLNNTGFNADSFTVR